MKKTLFAIIAIISVFYVQLMAQDTPPTPPQGEWWSNFSITPFGAVSHTDFQGKPTWGSGLDLGYYINKTLSLHGSAMGSEENGWSDPAIKEASLLFQADLIRDSRERFVGFLLGGVDRYWSNTKIDGEHIKDGWGLGVGGGGEVRISKNFSLGVDYRVRLREEGEFGSIGRGFLRIRF